MYNRMLYTLLILNGRVRNKHTSEHGLVRSFFLVMHPSQSPLSFFRCPKRPVLGEVATDPAIQGTLLRLLPGRRILHGYWGDDIEHFELLYHVGSNAQKKAS